MSCLVQVINLNRATDRLRHFDMQANAAGFAYRRFEAIEGAEPGVQEITRGTKVSMGLDPLRSNEIALGLSHRACWRNLLDSDYDCTIVFEDDVVLAPGFETVLRDGWIPKGADIVKLEAFQSQSTKVSTRVFSSVGGRNLHRLRADHVGLAAYLVTRKGAEKLLHGVSEISAPIDILVFCAESPLFHTCQIYQMVPAPCTQGMFVEPDAEWALSSVQVKAETVVPGVRPKQVESQGIVGEANVARRKRKISLARLRNRVKNLFVGKILRIKVPFG